MSVRIEKRFYGKSTYSNGMDSPSYSIVVQEEDGKTAYEQLDAALSLLRTKYVLADDSKTGYSPKPVPKT